MKPFPLSRWTVPLVLLLLVGCHPNGGSEGPGTQGQPDIIGTWLWAESTGGIGGITRTHEKTGETWSIEFRKDWTYRELRAGNETFGKFAIENRPSIFDHEARPALVIDGRIDQIIEAPNRGQLVLNDNVVDGFRNVFVRTRTR